jgi:hypothetical protein
MKKTLVGLCALLVTLGAFAQGTVNFNTRVPADNINAPVFLSDGVTKATGPQYVAQLLGGTSAATLAPIGTPIAFKTGALAGYVSSTTALTIPGIPLAGPASVQVVAWDSVKFPTLAAAQAANELGQSAVLSLTKTGNPNDPTVLPSNLLGLTSFNIPGPAVPEPSTLALAFAGGIGLLAYRRRK